MTESTLCQWREDGSLCTRMADHDGDHMRAPDTSLLVDPIYSELTTAEKVDQLYTRVGELESKLVEVWGELQPLLGEVLPMIEAVQNSRGFRMLVGDRAARKLKEGKR